MHKKDEASLNGEKQILHSKDYLNPHYHNLDFSQTMKNQRLQQNKLNAHSKLKGEKINFLL